MRFDDFLITQINKQLPIDKLKADLSYFKNTFNYAAKTDELYDNLINNIVFILQRKFGRFTIIYKDVDIMYAELLLTLSPQIPQFLMIQKKQLLESLDTFADLNNWGEILKDNIKRDLNLTTTGENTTNYIPIDALGNKDPYSTDEVSSNETQGENTNVNRNIANYLDFYENITWNIADLELEKILKPYYKMFKLYYGDDLKIDTSNSLNDVERRLTNLEQADLLFAEELDTTNHNVSSNRDEINNNAQQINANKQEITDLQNDKANKTDLDNYYTKTQSDNNYYSKTEANSRFGKLEFANTWRQTNTFTQDLNINGENSLLNLTIGAGSNNKTLINKEYVDNNFLGKNEVPVLTNYYTKQECDDKFMSYTYANANYYNRTQSDDRYYQKSQVYNKSEADTKFGLKSIQDTNSTNIVNLNNTKADKTQLNNYYTKQESDGRYALLSSYNSLASNLQNNYYDKSYIDNNYSTANQIYNKYALKIKWFSFDLRKATWVAGGALGGRWDVYDLSPIQFPGGFDFDGVLKFYVAGGYSIYDVPKNHDIFFGGKIDTGDKPIITIKRWDSNDNMNKDNWQIGVYYIPYRL